MSQGTKAVTDFREFNAHSWSNSKELTKEMLDFLTCVSDAGRDGGRSNLTTDDWLEKFGTEFPNIQGYYVTNFNIIESM